jgi:hypothetical protein
MNDRDKRRFILLRASFGRGVNVRIWRAANMATPCEAQLPASRTSRLVKPAWPPLQGSPDRCCVLKCADVAPI